MESSPYRDPLLIHHRSIAPTKIKRVIENNTKSQEEQLGRSFDAYNEVLQRNKELNEKARAINEQLQKLRPVHAQIKSHEDRLLECLKHHVEALFHYGQLQVQYETIQDEKGLLGAVTKRLNRLKQAQEEIQKHSGELKFSKARDRRSLEEYFNSQDIGDVSESMAKKRKELSFTRFTEQLEKRREIVEKRKGREMLCPDVSPEWLPQ